MSKSIRNCCVPGCEDKTSRRHRFPQNKQLLEFWVKRINSPKLHNMTIEQIAASGLVCESHFAPMNITCGGRYLLKGSVPTLKIPGFDEVPTKENCFYFSLATKLFENNVITMATEPSTVTTSRVYAVPGISKNVSPEIKLLKTDPSKRKTYVARPRKIKQELEDTFESKVQLSPAPGVKEEPITLLPMKEENLVPLSHTAIQNVASSSLSTLSKNTEETIVPTPEKKENIVPLSSGVIKDVASGPSTSPKNKKQSELKRRRRQRVVKRMSVRRITELPLDARKMSRCIKFLLKHSRRLKRSNATVKQNITFLLSIMDKEPMISFMKLCEKYPNFRI